jgi:rare lipoprotein A
MKSLDKPLKVQAEGHSRSVAALSCLAILATAACSSAGDVPPVAASSPAPAPSAAVIDGPPRVGAAYSIGGRTYTPSDQVDYDEVGYASWYGAELEGRPTASGEPFVSTGFTAAHRTLPLPSYVEVTRLDTGRTILVRINDRGPADPNRTIDLSTGAAEQLGIAELGMVPVRIRRTNPVETERAALRSGRPAAARIDTPSSLLEILRERAARLPVPTGARPVTAAPSTARAVVPPAATPAVPASSTPAAPVAPAAAGPAGSGGYIVQVAAFSSRARADALARRLGATVVAGGTIYRVRMGPYATAAEAQASVARARSLGQPGAIIQRER